MVDRERSGMHYGQRAWGLLVGPRSRVADLNRVVRRHTDWTLTAKLNKYILDWRRNAAKAGTNILVTREQLKKLQADYRAGNKTPVNDGLKAKADEWKSLIDESRKILADSQKVEAELEKEIARVLMNTGAGNLMADNPLVKKSGEWHRKLITPYDGRIQRRHEAPIGDTHCWDSGMSAEGFTKLASFYKESD